LKKAQAVVQKTSRKNVMSTVLIFFFFSAFLMDVMGGKITNNLKNCAEIEKEETHAHQKRARSALIRERTLELRQ
jgi:Na+-transporting methylmalonyl-CoA/oxaloacetate decarboxylase gamma subunit